MGDVAVLPPPKLTPAEQALCAKALPVLRSMAARYARRYTDVSADDFTSAASVVLAEKIRRFDPALGTLDAFAFVWAERAMLDLVRNTARDNRRRRELRLRPMSAVLPTSLTERMQLSDADIRQRAVNEIRGRVAEAVAADMLEAGEGGEDEHLDRRAYAMGLSLLQTYEARLEDPERTYFRRAIREEWTQDAIAAELGISSRTVRRVGERVQAGLISAFREARVL